jgi:hypothetical protein
MKKPIWKLHFSLSLALALSSSSLKATEGPNAESDTASNGYLDPDTNQVTEILSFSATCSTDGVPGSLSTSFVKGDQVLQFVQEQIEVFSEQKIFVGDDSWSICQTSEKENNTICKIKFAPSNSFALTATRSQFVDQALQCASAFAGIGGQDPLQSICEPDGLMILSPEQSRQLDQCQP